MEVNILIFELLLLNREYKNQPLHWHPHILGYHIPHRVFVFVCDRLDKFVRHSTCPHQVVLVNFNTLDPAQTISPWG